jgi:hypothetical protein
MQMTNQSGLIHHDGCRIRPDTASSLNVPAVFKALETMK